MIGASSVGKTSLVERYVNSIFSDKYLSTVGVKISKKALNVADDDVTLVLWDMEGKDEFSDINVAYLRGAMGFILVADVTRLDTFEEALNIRQTAFNMLGSSTPHILLLNKSDLPDWEVGEKQIEQAQGMGISFLHTSAKTGHTVEEAFEALTKAMLEKT